ncbi:MAG: FAD-dependent oxidoreductase [Acidisphaera sp.]|nr:FAD-dependent oxidoreductase [Acidisphaera sp.]
MLPSHARVAIIGGGAVGCSALYHLAKLGWTDTILLEKDELTSGSTWHAAGNCPNFSGSWGLMKLQRYSTALYARLGEEAGYPITYTITGAVRLAHTTERLDELRHITAMARHQGIEFAMLTPSELQERYPFVALHDLLGAQCDPLDGDIDPAQLTQAFAKAARDLGARIIRFCPVLGLAQLPDGQWRIDTRQGTVTAEIVVNAAGYRADEIGVMVGRDVPNVALSHQYLVTEDIPELVARPGKLPILRDPDDSYYLRQERHGLLLGPYEWQATPHWTGGKPADFSFQLFPDDLERLQPQIESACARVPILGSVGIKKVINGPIPYTPDGNPLIGPAPGLRNFFECCVFSFGIVQAGGAGKTIAEWIVEGEPEWDLWSCDPRRYTGFVTRPYVVAKAIELYQNEYAIGFPFEERPAGRPVRTSPLYPLLRAKAALFGPRNGWERATWFPRDMHEVDSQPTLRRPAWFAAVAEECRAVAERVGVADLPGFSRFELRGRGAAAWLDGLIAGALPRVGRIALAYVLTGKGGVLSEMTVTRLGEDHFWLLGASAGEWHDEDRLRASLPSGIELRNTSAHTSTLVLAGPRSRDLLSTLTRADLGNDAFPWLSWRRITVGAIEVTALRVNYVGELGWELHVPMENLVAVYEMLHEAGRAYDIRDFGLYAIDSLRLEKCYRSWKQDLSTEWSAWAAGLNRFVKLEKPDFPGRSALLTEQRQGIRERLVPLLVDATDADAPAFSSVFDNGKRVGLVTSGGYGHRLERSIALAYIRADLASPGRALEVEIFGERRRATVGVEPLYDPANARLKA